MPWIKGPVPVLLTSRFLRTCSSLQPIARAAAPPPLFKWHTPPLFLLKTLPNPLRERPPPWDIPSLLPRKTETTWHQRANLCTLIYRRLLRRKLSGEHISSVHPTVQPQDMCQDHFCGIHSLHGLYQTTSSTPDGLAPPLEPRVSCVPL